MTSAPIVFVLKGYPRLSETFIAQEILGLEERGFDIRIVSLRHPTDGKTHPVHEAIRAPVTYLPEYLHDQPGRVWKSWRRARRLPGYKAAWRVWRRDFARDRTRNRFRRFGQALVLASELPDGAERLHAHFLHTPASVARYAALMTGLPFSVSAHAKDIWTSPEWEKREKLADADWAVTCTAAAHVHLAALAPSPDRVSLVYHGLDLRRFAPPGEPRDDSAASGTSGPVRLLSVGRAVEKKGFDLLLTALSQLPADLQWQWTHIGGGGESEALKKQATTLGLTDRVDWRGAQAQEAVLAAYRAADVFILPSRIAGDGDRDGLPNVLMEAQSQGLACLSTNISGIPELVIDGKTGRLVPPDDLGALTAALAELIENPTLRRAFGAAGQARVQSAFSHEIGILDLAQRFGAPASRIAA